MTRPAHARSHGPTGGSGTSRDDVLLDAAHSGDAEAFRALRERYHGTALAVARSRTGSEEESERLAAAAFERIERIVREGGGPRAFLGAFVVWMVGREADGGTRPVALPDDPSDPASLVRVFSGLPAEWQGFLWRTEVLGHSPRRAAAALGLGAVAAAGLHRDMVRGLRGLYARAASERAAGQDCAEFSGELAHFVRGTRGQRSRHDVKAHLDGCARCTAEYLSRQDVGTGLRTWTLPVLAGLPLWGTEALELATVVAGAGTGGAAAAAAGTGAAGIGARTAAVAGTGAAGAGTAADRPDEAEGTSAWSGRRTKVLLGAGALATAVAVAAVGVSGGGDPVPAAGGLAAEQAPRTAEDLERSSAEDSAARDARTDDEEAGDSGPERERGSVEAGEPGAGPLDVPAGAPEAAALVAVADRGTGEAGTVAGRGTGAAGAAEAGGAAAATGPSAGDRESLPGAVGEGSAPGRDGGGAAEAPASGAAAAGGSAQDPGAQDPGAQDRAAGDSAAGGSAAGAPSARRTEAPSAAPAPARKAAAPAPAPSVSSLPSAKASPAPLRAPAPPARTSAPPSDPARTGTAPRAGRQHAHAETGARGGRHDERQQWHRERSWDDDRREGRGKAGRQGRDQHREQHGRPGGHGGSDRGEGRSHR
ncbi:hypothetical protein AVL61_03125 [Kocuria rosea subsp. polaris]|uniref:Zinc-finger domain-containing protein n=1 Tax=Kocuria rosea subsp. polaris TaxID=136273 RepID=A0A0W8IPB0_KOCRO|nr:hypothetical protein [Kocuria polaris]KUG62082.1 hypothetical protein AVL61_03125 [Kocuria polaris]